MDYTIWTLLTDLGLIAALLLVGTLLRSKVRFIQELFLPASLIAGLLGLALGPNGFGLLPFSDAIGSYAGLLIALVFGALPLASQKVPWKTISTRVGNMWAYSQTLMIAQWGLGVLFGLVVIRLIWGDIHVGFGLMLASGFSGGHGTAAAVGQAFTNHGWPEAQSLAMTSATVGIISAILGGLSIIKWGTKKGYTKFLADFDDLPVELKTGVVSEEKRKTSGIETTSSISIDPLIFHFAFVALIAASGYQLAQLGARLFPRLSLPAFALAFIVGLIVKQIIQRTPADNYIDAKTITRISGSCTDLLVAFGVASISLPVVIEYALPLGLLLLFGITYCWVMFRYLGPKLFFHYWFEKSVFSFGWATGTMAMGIALLRIVDPELKSNSLNDFALAYVPIAPVEVIVVTFGPLMMVNGFHWAFVGLALGAAIAIMIFSKFKGWINPNPIGSIESHE